LDVERLRAEFPILRQRVGEKPLVYLDNASTTQKPRAVIDAIARFYSDDYANIHRGVYALSERATQAYEEARAKVRRFINAGDDREIIFVRGTTEAINLVAHSFGRLRVEPGDEIVISAMEHHSNLVPWQIACAERGAVLRVAPVNDDGELRLDMYERLLTPRTRLVAIAHVSNALGTINPVREIVARAHGANIPVLLDGAQAVAHLRVDVQAIDCDFYAFSGHKLYGPSGIGVLYGKAALLDAMPPYQSGGDMIRTVAFDKTSYNRIPYKFEAGTPHIAGAVGLGAAIDYFQSVGIEYIAAYEQELLAYATARLSEIPRLRRIGSARQKACVLSFVLDNIHPHDVATVLDNEGVAVRAGHHCAQPLMERFGVAGTVRASMALYNTREEIDVLARGLRRALEVLR
jgi:cysteine desulfurase/selenocysteine lyase